MQTDGVPGLLERNAALRSAQALRNSLCWRFRSAVTLRGAGGKKKKKLDSLSLPPACPPLLSPSPKSIPGGKAGSPGKAASLSEEGTQGEG